MDKDRRRKKLMKFYKIDCKGRGAKLVKKICIYEEKKRQYEWNKKIVRDLRKEYLFVEKSQD